MNIDIFKTFTGESITDATGKYTFENLHSQINRYTELLQREIDKGDVVVVDSDYNFLSIALLLALSNYPCIIVPIVKTTDDEFESKVQASEANKVIRIGNKDKLYIENLLCEKSSYPKYYDITNEDKSGIVLFTSGTTGIPKSMVHDFTNLLQSFKPPRRQKKLKFLLFLMFDHIGGLNTLLNCLNNGSPLIIPENRNPSNVMDLIEKEGVQVLPTSPTFLNLMLQVDDLDQKDLSSLKMITYGTEKMPQALLEKLNRIIPNVRYLQTFGTSETGILKTQSKSSSSLYFKIVDDDIVYKIEKDQLFIKSKTSVSEYKGYKSEKFTNDGWFATGDLVEVDKDGYIKIVGRLNDVINVGGLKVLPSEIEDVINHVKGVVDSTAFAKENSITGQVVCAKVIIEKGIDEVELKKEIKNICKEKLDRYKVPVKFIFTNEIESTERFKKRL